MKWYLIYCDRDESWSIVEGSSIINVERVGVGDSVTFFYGNKPFVGLIKMSSVNRDDLDVEVKNLGKEARVSKCKKKDSCQDGGKRKSHSPKRFQPYSVSTPDAKQSESRCAKLQQTGSKHPKQTGAAAMHKQVMEAAGSIMQDSDNSSVDMGTHGSDSDDDIMLSMLNDKKEKNKQRDNLIARIRNQNVSNKGDAEALNGAHVSPSKDELKKMLLEATEKLAMMREGSSTSPSLSEKESIREASVSTHVQSHTSAQETKICAFKELFVNDSTNANLDENDGALGQTSFTSDGEWSGNASKGECSTNNTSGGNNTSAEKSATSLQELDVICNNDDDSQLLGKDYKGGQMVLLHNNIYCEKGILDNAVRQSSRPTHVARRLLSGVFKMESIVNCTLTGQKPRAAGRTNYEGSVTGLHSTALSAIIAYTKAVAKARKWDKCSSEQLRTAMTQKVGELTREYKKQKEAA